MKTALIYLAALVAISIAAGLAISGLATFAATAQAATSAPKTRQIMVYYPQNWPEHTYRRCMTDLNLLELDCDRLTNGQPSGHTPLDHIRFVDAGLVSFSGNAENQNWTCQNEGQSLSCKN